MQVTRLLAAFALIGIGCTVIGVPSLLLWTIAHFTITITFH